MAFKMSTFNTLLLLLKVILYFIQEQLQLYILF